jgi:short chain dehydrogenase
MTGPTPALAYHGGTSGLTLATRTVSRARNGQLATSSSACCAPSDPSCPSTIGPRVGRRATSTGHGEWSATSAATDPSVSAASTPWLWLPTMIVAGIVDRLLPVGELTDEVWERVLAVNLTGPMLAMRAAIPAMLRAGGGVIVNVSSIGGLFGARGGAAYAASRHGLIGLTKNVAATYGRDGIRAIAVCPGAVDTGISLGGAPSPKGFAALNATLPRTRARRLRSRSRI